MFGFKSLENIIAITKGKSIFAPSDQQEGLYFLKMKLNGHLLTWISIRRTLTVSI